MTDVPGPDVERRSVFDETLGLLEAAGVEIVDMSREQLFVETKHACYAIVEGPKWSIARVGPLFTQTVARNKKNFAIHAPYIEPEWANEIEKQGYPSFAAAYKVRYVLATTSMQMRRNVDDFESTATVPSAEPSTTTKRSWWR